MLGSGKIAFTPKTIIGAVRLMDPFLIFTTTRALKGTARVVHMS